MPTYDYACDACKHTWEEFQPITAKPTKKCPNCKKQKAKRLIGAGAGLLFKGSGFYITDYKKKSGTPDGGGKSADAGKKSESKSETKAAAK